MGHPTHPEDRLSDAKLLALLDRLAGSARLRRLRWFGPREMPTPRPEKFADRNDVIRKRRREGWTLGQLAAEYMLSRARICRILRQGKW